MATASAPASPRKRKRAVPGEHTVTVRAPPSTPTAGPFLVAMPESIHSRFVDQTHAFKAFRKRDHDAAPNDRALISDLGTTIVTATNYYEPAPAVPVVNYAIGLYDPHSQEVTVVDATLLTMRTEVKAFQTMTSPTKAEQTYAERRNILGETFGTKKVKQAIRAIERNQIDVTTLKPIAGLIEDTIVSKAEEIPSMDEITLEMQLDRPIPPYNADADRADEVYNFDDIISPEEMKDLTRPTKPWVGLTREMHDELRDSKRFPEYVLQHLNHMIDSPKKDKRKLKMLLYVTYLMRFWFVRQFDAEENVRSNVGSDCPTSVFNRLMSQFLEKQEDVKTGTTKAVMTPRKKDLLASYILVLCLFIEENLTLDPLAVASDLKLERSKIVDKLRNLGCTAVYLTNRDGSATTLQEASSASTSLDDVTASPSAQRLKYLRLQLPLNFPKPKRGVRR